jgi:hypothetical protein
MSIYATLWALRFPRFGEYHSGCAWVTVLAQGVPGHIGAEAPDPHASFLPPAPESIAADLRAVVFVTGGWPKGTFRSAQEYVAPLLVLSGTEYASTPFPLLHTKLCDALRGDRPRLTAEIHQPDGNSTLLFDDGSTLDGESGVRKHGD